MSSIYPLEKIRESCQQMVKIALENIISLNVSLSEIKKQIKKEESKKHKEKKSIEILQGHFFYLDEHKEQFWLIVVHAPKEVVFEALNIFEVPDIYDERDNLISIKPFKESLLKEVKEEFIRMKKQEDEENEEEDIE